MKISTSNTKRGNAKLQTGANANAKLPTKKGANAK
jgi:hypothetical protein